MKRCSETSTSEDQQPETKYSLELLEWDHLWKQAPVFPIGEKWTDPRVLSKHNWKFSNLQVSTYSIPLGQRGDTPLPQISVISHVQNAATLDIGVELGPDSHICLPYFDNLSKAKQSTVVDIVYPAKGEPIVVGRFDWKLTWRETYIDGLINKGKLSIDHRDAFTVFLKEKVIQAKRANRKAILALEELRRTDEKVAAFENMRFYKFYPDFAVFQSLRINPYYDNAHQVF